MNNEERSIIFPEKEAIIKVGGQERGHGRTPTPSHPIPFWTKWGWRAAYWRQAHWQPPHWQSPLWLATGCALLLVLAMAAASMAYDGEPALRQRAAGMRVASSANSVTAAPQPPVTPALSEVEVAVSPALYATGSAIYIVQPDDTLYRIASRHNTTMEALDQINQLNNTVSVGQVLVIPPVGWRTTAVPTDHYACAQFSFHQGGRSAQAGIYALHDVTGGQIAAWSAPTGAMASGWIYDLPVAFASVHARVLFYPRYGGGTAVEMKILNHAPDTTAGWLTRGLCHSLELAFP